MGEEAKMSEYDGDAGGEEERVLEWETGLPSVDDLTPLSQPLIPPELASAFSITPVQYRTIGDVNQASQDTLSSLRFGTFGGGGESHDSAVLVDGDEDGGGGDDGEGSGSETRKSRRIDAEEVADSALPAETSGDDAAARTLKRPRLVWTPQLHKRFVDVVGHLGIKNAVPKTIMQLMNVEGLTRENVASHLQKYRLYLKRMQGLSSDGPSPSDHLFSSTPVPPQSLNDSTSAAAPGSGNGHGHGHGHGNGHFPVPVPMPMPYAPPMPMPMPMPMMTHNGHGHMGMPVGYHHGFEAHHHQYNMLHQQQQRDWSANNYGSVVTFPHVAPSDK